MMALFSKSKTGQERLEPAEESRASKPTGILNKPLLPIVVGAALILSMTIMLFTGSRGEQDNDKALEQGQRAVSQVQEALLGFSRLVEDEQVLDLAGMAIDDPKNLADLERYLVGRMSEIVSVRLYGPQDYLARVDPASENAFIIMDMLAQATERGKAPLQSFVHDGEPVISSAVVLAGAEAPRGVLVVMATLEVMLSRFNMTIPQGGYIGLEQRNGRFASSTLREFGDPSLANNSPRRLNVPGSLFRVVVPKGVEPSVFPAWLRLLIFVLGGLALAYGLISRQRALRPVMDLTEDPAMLDQPADDKAGPEGEPEAEPQAQQPEPEPLPPPVSLEDLRFDPAQHRREHRQHPEQAVTMKEEIFRAYDIRGIVGESLDREVARRVGQAIGSNAVEAGATPVVVGRDGRHSGPDLVQGMVEGIASAGCDVIDIGAVPTGVLYYMANECGSGSGVMITGSHNPPEYNGFKVMIGFETLAGDKIKALYRRLKAENVLEGEGAVTREAVLERYRERIASDIQLERPLRVVADCGNGIGGICAAEVLRAIGAEVLPLFDEVDGDFPNHHPDPSEPENLEDLIESVKLMKADLGVAFDGDADRLGVVTPSGDIIYADRVMMLFVREILSRNPGAPIIYDVKCTGHLDKVIREAGGVPEMYKTGHSLIKNRMKEAGAPFAGEMSGHFFFGDRWYGFDCGIYSAARLLEILAMDERAPEEVLNSLPNSISTPELKVYMSEGENHAFIERFQQQASFPDARISTIDGVRADFEDGWGLCRASNTTPILVVRFDGESEEALQVIQEAFRMQMLAINPDLELPF
jgi:phosphomannomutase/phosphoglucomutase